MIFLLINSKSCSLALTWLKTRFFEAERSIWLVLIWLSLLSPKLSVYYWQLRCYWKYVIFLLINFKSCSLVLIWLENMFLKQRDRSDLFPFDLVYYHLDCQYITDNSGVIENMWSFCESTPNPVHWHELGWQLGFLKQRDPSDLIQFDLVYHHLNCQYITDNSGVIENMWSS